MLIIEESPCICQRKLAEGKFDDDDDLADDDDDAANKGDDVVDESDNKNYDDTVLSYVIDENLID